MKKIIFSLLVFFFALFVSAQTVQPIRQNDSTSFMDYLAGLKYAEIEAPKLLVNEMKQKNVNVVTAHIQSMYEYLQAMGFRKVTFTQVDPIEIDSLKSLCELVRVKVSYTVQKRNVTNVIVRFTGCDGKIFYEFEQKGKLPLNNVEAYKKLYAGFLPKKLPGYDPKKTLFLSCLGRSALNEVSVKAYLDTVATDSVEGIYELQNFEQALKIAIVRSASYYDIIYLSGFRNSIDWPEGELFGRLKITNRQQFYTAEWCGFNKNRFESVPCKTLDCALVFTMGSVQYYFVKTYPLKK